MLQIEKMQLNQVRFANRASLVPSGEIIQTSCDDQIIIGLRTFFNDGTEAIMLIGGQDHCRIVSLESVGNKPSLIITSLVRLIATDLMPFDPAQRPPERGNLLQMVHGAFVARGQIVRKEIPQTPPAFVYLTPDPAIEHAKAVPSGTAVQVNNMTQARGISRSFSIEVITDPVRVVST
jgi:hypothetical protein